MGNAANETKADSIPREWFTTTEAAEYLRITPKALRNRVARGSIVPDVWGGRGRSKEHMFHLDTLRAYYGRGKAA
jgi:hypothetical protein